MTTASRRIAVFAPLALAALAGCAVRPAGEKKERERAEAMGRHYEESAKPEPLPDDPGPDDYLRHAFLANADLESRYWDWRSAIERIPQDASPPNAALPFSVMFNSGNMRLWDRTTLGVMNDPMTNIPFPSKLAAAGRRALEDARAAGLRFEAAKFRLQANVLSAYYDLALIAESIRIREETVSLTRQMAAQAEVMVGAGLAPQNELLRAQTEVELVDNDLANLRSRVPPAAARLNALVGRPADAVVLLPAALPERRELDVPDAELIRLGSERSSELEALARDVAGREEALSLARQAYIPDFGLQASITGGIAQTLGGMIVLPTRLEAIRAGIEQARAQLRAAEAARTQYARDLAASFVLNLAVLRDDERQIALFDESIIPRARQTVDIARTAYSASRASFADLLDAERVLLDARLALAQFRIEREKSLAAIETWAAIDAGAMLSGRRGGRAIGGLTEPMMR